MNIFLYKLSHEIHLALLIAILVAVAVAGILYWIESTGKRYRIRKSWTENLHKNSVWWYVERTRFGIWWTNTQSTASSYDTGYFDSILDASRYYEDAVRGSSKTMVVFPADEAQDGSVTANMFLTARAAAIAAPRGSGTTAESVSGVDEPQHRPMPSPAPPKKDRRS